MTVGNISTLSIQQSLVTNLQNQQSTLTDLTAQLSSQKKHSNLTDYAPSDALNLMNLQNSATQKQAYLQVISAVQTRLSTYDTTMTDMESVVTQAKALASSNQSYNPSTVSSLSAQATTYLQSVGIDLNQQINGRYIYAGSRYTTQPVVDLTTLSGTPSTTIYNDGKTLPVYDSSYVAGPTLTTSGQTITVGGTVSVPQTASATINGTTYTYTVQSGDTATSVASGLSTLIAAAIPGTTSSGAVITVGGTGTINSTSSASVSTAAYATDSATVDTGYTLSYGVASTNPAFQQMIAGLRYLKAATATTDPTTYQTDMQQATSLLTSALSSLQGLHTTVANNTNLMSSEKDTQNTAINNLTSQVSDIQQVDVTQVSTEITLLQTILQASYSVTGNIERMSIVSYL